MKHAAIPIACGLLVAAAWAQDRPRVRGGTTQDPPVFEVQGPGRTKIVAGEAGWNPELPTAPPPSLYDTTGVSFSAVLLHPRKSAAGRSVDIAVHVSGIQLVDPDLTNGQAKRGQAHLTYRVDYGPVVVTTATRLEFARLPSGNHEIIVALAANDGAPLGPHRIFHVRIP
jgi:hypothetical protein